MPPVNRDDREDKRERAERASARASARGFRARMREGFPFVYRGFRCVIYVFLLVIALRIY